MGKVAIEEEKPMRRKKKEPSIDETDVGFAAPEKPKVKDEFAEKEKKPKEEEQKIVIPPAKLPEKPEPAPEVPPPEPEVPEPELEFPSKPKAVSDEFAEREKILITPAKLPEKKPEEEES